MEQEQKQKNGEGCCVNKNKCGFSPGCGGVYGVAFAGALIYYIQHAETFWQGVLGVLKAAVWPAMLAYQLLEFLGK